MEECTYMVGRSKKIECLLARELVKIKLKESKQEKFEFKQTLPLFNFSFIWLQFVQKVHSTYSTYESALTF